MTGNLPFRQFSVDDFAKMLATGILGEDDRVELIDGTICTMTPVGPWHCGVVALLIAVLSGGWGVVNAQNPIRLTDHTEPQPDLWLARPRRDCYKNSHPQPEDLLLLVEVAESSLEYDRDEKIPRYAQAMIPEVWLVDLRHGEIIQFWLSDGTAFQHQKQHRTGDTLASRAVPGLQINVADILRTDANA